MPKKPIAAAQRGVELASVARPRARRARAGFKGPFLSPGSLSTKERVRLIDGIEKVLEGVYAHLPLKRARYGFDPIQRLRILCSQVSDLADDQFHYELADIITRLRDAHTCYAGPASLEDKVAVLPFLVEMFGPADAPNYVVTKVTGRHGDFKPGVVLEYWNGIPIDRAVERHGDREVGGRPDSQRAWAVQSLTFRSLQYGPPPDEHWVVIGYRTVTASGKQGRAKEIKIPWRIVDPGQVAVLERGGPEALRKALRRTRAVDPAAAAIRRAKMLLFAPASLTGTRSAPARRQVPSSRRAAFTEKKIPSDFPGTFKAASVDAPGGPFGYLRIWAFDETSEKFIPELLRLISLLPDRGLIIDLRGNPGGYIWSSEFALQLFTPKRVEPTRFSPLATEFTRDICTIGDLVEDLGPWKESLDAAVRNGELYGQAIPIADPEACNDIGQQYGGPVLLVGDSTTYSAGDLFCAGFVDNGIGPFLCVGAATGAGGANVWEYAELKQALTGSPSALPKLPEGIDLSFSFRRATRSGPSEGLPIEDVGIEGTPYAMTRDDLLQGNRDLIATCITRLKQLPFSRLATSIDTTARAITITTEGLDRLDVFFGGHPGSSQSIKKTDTVNVTYPARTKVVELAGFAGDEVRQRRRIDVRP